MLEPTKIYVNSHNSRKVNFTLTKDITYLDVNRLKDKMMRLKMLQSEDFGKIKIPNFIFEQTGDLSLRIISEYVKGRYADRDDMIIIQKYAVERINKPNAEYSFGDFNASNWIVENKDPWDLYAIDVDSYQLIDIKRRWIKYKKNVEQHERYQRLYGLDMRR
jgi:hypothetical protein